MPCTFIKTVRLLRSQEYIFNIPRNPCIRRTTYVYCNILYITIFCLPVFSSLQHDVLNVVEVNFVTYLTVPEPWFINDMAIQVKGKFSKNPPEIS